MRKFELWQVVLVGVVATFLAFMAGPFIPAPLVALAFFTYIKQGLHKGSIYKPITLDYIIIGVISVVLVIVYFGMLIHAYNVVPLWKIIIAGIIADILAFALGKYEYLFDKINPRLGTIVMFASAVLVFFVTSWIVGGGIAGIVFGGIAAAGTSIKGPIPVTTLSFMILYFATNYLGSKINDLRFALGL